MPILEVKEGSAVDSAGAHVPYDEDRRQALIGFGWDGNFG